MSVSTLLERSQGSLQSNNLGRGGAQTASHWSIGRFEPGPCGLWHRWRLSNGLCEIWRDRRYPYKEEDTTNEVKSVYFVFLHVSSYAQEDREGSKAEKNQHWPVIWKHEHTHSLYSWRYCPLGGRLCLRKAVSWALSRMAWLWRLGHIWLIEICILSIRA